jgi:outer membrane protein OmpA-like peptidoglycan-associated protein
MIMKILIIGFLAFFAWSAVSTYIYVCKIKGLCDAPVAMQISTIGPKDVIAGDTTRKPGMQEQVVIPNDLIIHFAFDQSEFIFDAETDKYFNESNAYLNKNSLAWLIITGHTDAIGSCAYNQALGYRRAQSIQYYFESKGLPANRIIIESEGEKKPADDNNPTTGRANNRRAAITIKK